MAPLSAASASALLCLLFASQAAHGFLRSLGTHSPLLHRAAAASLSTQLAAVPSNIEGTLSMDVHDFDASASAQATNYAIGYAPFTAKVVKADGTECDGVAVFPAEGKFGPKNSEPSKEKVPGSDRLMRPYGATIRFTTGWTVTEPQLNIQTTGAPLGYQRVWSNSTLSNFPDDAYLVVDIIDEEQYAWKLDFKA